MTEDDFVERIEFKFGLPLIVLDFIDQMAGSDFIKVVQTYVNPQTHIERLNEMQTVELRELKDIVDDGFCPYIFSLFNALGNIDLNDLGK